VTRVVVLNTAIGFEQELKAGRSVAALKRMSAPRVRVRRDGAVAEVLEELLVKRD
jgi:Ca2+-transporting ATPase